MQNNRTQQNKIINTTQNVCQHALVYNIEWSQQRMLDKVHHLTTWNGQNKECLTTTGVLPQFKAMRKVESFRGLPLKVTSSSFKNGGKKEKW